MPIEKIITPLGGTLSVHGLTQEDVADRVRDVVVPYWESYCSSHWLSSNHEDLLCPERRVKFFLDRCGTLLVFGLPGIETRYKEMAHKVREIPMSDCPATIRNCMYSGKILPDDVSAAFAEESRFAELQDKLDSKAEGKYRGMPVVTSKRRTKPKARVETAFDRAQEIRKDYPNATIEICTVATDGIFRYHGKDYSVASRPEYRSVNTPAGEYYAMDKVAVVDTGILLRLYDQNLRFMSECPKKC